MNNYNNTNTNINANYNNYNNSSIINGWIYYPWPSNSTVRSWRINELEMAAIAIALTTFGDRLSGRIIHIHCDNSTTVIALNKQRSRSPLLLRLLRGIYATALQYNFHIRLISHIRGTHNIFADCASRLYSQSPIKLNELGMRLHQRMITIIPPWLHSLMMQINY